MDQNHKVPEGWRKVKLSEIAIITMGQSPSSKDCGINSEGMPFFQGNAEFGEKYPTPRVYTKKHLRVAKEGDILVSVRAPVGDVNINTTNSCIGRGISSISPTEINREFLFYILKNKGKHFEKLQQGSTFKAINSNDLKEMEIALATPKEQQKIAAILTSVDDNIEETDKIIAQCERVKKGLMQALLTKGILGRHKKFKETELGRVPEEWNVCAFRDVVKKFRNGGTPNTKNESYWNGTIPWVTGADFVDGKIAQIRRSITDEAVKNSATNVISKGDLLLVTRTGVGKMAIAPFDITISQDVTGITFKEEIMPEYAFWYMRKHITRLQAVNQGTSINGIIRDDLEELIFLVPDMHEQKEIVGILDTFERRAEQEYEKKTKLRGLKQALMQKLLSGEIRVKVN